ncbi:2-succinyl-5-enolpyruvyl-6-hydroxy-3-cyclohexene-1-carboxylic-acid synthase [Diaminobutyricimonas sp. LJ205]|uniref:2-succinyl-5-enolpyruvyl-6-hydroxy-3- cyclohexene-1-carboxylic-acid synthase n=1 Tax=Diaminobutyricimonas sp. LJ205 TaxID=2683590 RepID=UPI0012F48EBF|nr:2-succinyl-5-enolpyruvyl-6-hydroxy-3-cyclohexene-1-carboxylic-acid synthase [Diaminobutyricimonas sp. LJ205]
MTLPTRSEAPATVYAVALFTEMVRLGVRDVVLSPGSRSQALALTAAAFEEAGLIRLRVRIDERVAGFVGVGLAVETQTPVVVITTSGTAVANLHPAVLEAHHAGVPLIVLTADRPEELRGIGSNQTTRQDGIFGRAVRRDWDVPAPTGAAGEADAAASLAREVIAAASGPGTSAGPVHVNLAFREPLSSAVDLSSLAPERPSAARTRLETNPSGPVDPATVLHPAPHTIVVAGQSAGEQAEETARLLGAPLIAEIASGAHFGPNLVVSYRELLRDPEFGGRVERVIVFGHPTLTREVPALIQRDDVQTIVVRSPGADDYNPGHRVQQFVDAVTIDGDLPADTRAWVGSWVHTSRAVIADSTPAPDVAASRSYDRLDRAAFARAELAAVREPVTRRLLAEAVWRATWPHDRLVLGASRIIRDADKVVPGKKLRVHANRGLAGIDGTISTAVGIALAAQDGGQPGTTRVLLGDLTLLHDVGGLLFGTGEPRPRLQVIVGNDGGGTIFDGLEVAASTPASAMDRVMFTPQTVDLAALAAAYGWAYRRVEHRGELDQALTAPDAQLIIEVPLPR